MPGFQLNMELIVTPRCLKNAKPGESKIRRAWLAKRKSGDLENDLHRSLHDALISCSGDAAEGA